MMNIAKYDIKNMNGIGIETGNSIYHFGVFFLVHIAFLCGDRLCSQI